MRSSRVSRRLRSRSFLRIMAEVERQLSINEDVLRWLTVRVEELDLELSPLLARRERERERSTRDDSSNASE